MGFKVQAIAGLVLGAIFGAGAVVRVNAVIAGVCMVLAGLLGFDSRRSGRGVGGFLFPVGITFGVASVVLGLARMVLAQ
ncbi:MAG: hypothetical protein Q8K63_09425 [Acidimicrobiales bacterium]|nr:hypothetical protein [Acidimicrobiales bacterium]